MHDDRGAFRLCRLQQEVGEWSEKNFGKQPAVQPFLGIVEEVGELSHAILKEKQGIRHTPQEIRDMKVDAIADIVIYLCDYCEREGIDLEGAVMTTWNKVKKRDWTANPIQAAAIVDRAERLER